MGVWKYLLAVTTAFIVALQAGLAQDAMQETDSPIEFADLGAAYLLVAAIFVMFVALGFAMRHAGLVRTKNAADASLRGLAVYGIAGFMLWLLGYNLAYDIEAGGLLGEFHPWTAAGGGAPDAHAAGAVWFFRMAGAALAALIVSGALSERLKLRSLLLFCALLTGVICPIETSWSWGGGFLDAKFAFLDLGGASLIHSAGGWAALAGALVLGPRGGKYAGGHVVRTPAASPPLAAFGAFIMWIGWLGANAGSLVALGAAPEAAATASIFINTGMAAGSGVLAAMALTKIVYGKVDLTVALNGVVGGLVSISAEPLAPAIWQAMVIGAFGGAIVMLAAPVLDRLKIDDAVGAIPAHLLCGVWGTLIVPWSNHDATWLGQIAGIAMIGIFVFGMSLLAWIVLKYTLGIRISAEREQSGLDRAELGLETQATASGG